jgi:fumarate reductase subunit C
MNSGNGNPLLLFMPIILLAFLLFLISLFWTSSDRIKNKNQKVIRTIAITSFFNIVISSLAFFDYIFRISRYFREDDPPGYSIFMLRNNTIYFNEFTFCVPIILVLFLTSLFYIIIKKKP